MIRQRGADAAAPQRTVFGAHERMTIRYSRMVMQMVWPVQLGREFPMRITASTSTSASARVVAGFTEQGRIASRPSTLAVDGTRDSSARNRRTSVEGVEHIRGQLLPAVAEAADREARPAAGGEALRLHEAIDEVLARLGDGWASKRGFPASAR